jgi:hypothetical protein
MAKDCSIMVRLEASEHDTLTKLAKDDGDRSISAYVRNVLREHLQKVRPKTRIRA